MYNLPEGTPRTITLDPFDFIRQTESDGTTVRTFEYTGMNTAGDTFVGSISINTGSRFTEEQFDSAMFIEPSSVAAIEVINGVPAFHGSTNRSELQVVLGMPLTVNETNDGVTVLPQTTAANIRSAIDAQQTLSAAQLDVVNARPFTAADETRLDSVQPFALDTTTDIPDAKVPDSIARDNELINNLEINNANLEAYTAASPSTPVASVSLGTIGAPVEYVFSTIADRNSGMQSNGQQITDYPARVIYATVVSDDQTTTGVTTTTFWTLIDRPASGATTTADDWTELGAPGVQISSVIGCVYDPDNTSGLGPDVNGFVEVQLGTEDTTEGISQSLAESLFFQQSERFSELVVDGDDATTAANRQAAQTNLDVAPSEEIVQINARLQDEVENIDPFTNLPHASNYTYTEIAALSDSIDEDANEDFYNSLGLFMVWEGDVSSAVQEGDNVYIFNNGDSTTGTPQLVLRRNGISPTTLNTRTQLSWTVVEGFSWLEQFLEQPSFPGSSTRNMNIDTTEGRAAFQHFFTRASDANLSSYIRFPAGGGQPTLAHASDSVPGSGSGRGELVSGLSLIHIPSPRDS